jgi:hypothetical protein
VQKRSANERRRLQERKRKARLAERTARRGRREAEALEKRRQEAARSSRSSSSHSSSSSTDDDDYSSVSQRAVKKPERGGEQGRTAGGSRGAASGGRRDRGATPASRGSVATTACAAAPAATHAQKDGKPVRALGNSAGGKPASTAAKAQVAPAASSSKVQQRGAPDVLSTAAAFGVAWAAMVKNLK